MTYITEQFLRIYKSFALWRRTLVSQRESGRVRYKRFVQRDIGKAFIGLANVVVPFNPVFHFLRNPSLFSLFFFTLYHHSLENQLILRKYFAPENIATVCPQLFIFATICLCDDFSLRRILHATICPCNDLSMRRIVCNNLSATICLTTFCPSAGQTSFSRLLMIQ